MFRLKNYLNEKGMSLLELVIALGIAGVISVFVADMMTEQGNRSSLAQITSEINAQHDVMQKTLRNKDACNEILQLAEETGAFNVTDGRVIEGIGRKNTRTENTIVGVKTGNKGKYEITNIVARNSPLSTFVKRFVITYTIPNKKIIDGKKTIIKTIDVLAEKTASGNWKCGNLVENSRKEATRQMCLSLGTAVTWIEDASNVENYDCVLNEFKCTGTNVPVRLEEFGKFECKPAKDVVDMTELVDPSPVDCTNKPMVSLITNGTKLKLSCTGTGVVVPPSPTCTPAAEWDSPPNTWSACDAGTNLETGTRTKTCGNTAPASGCPNNCTGSATETTTRSCTAACTPVSPPNDIGDCCGERMVMMVGTIPSYPFACQAGKSCWCETPTPPSCPLTKPACSGTDTYEASSSAPNCKTAPADGCTSDCVDWGASCENTLHCREKQISAFLHCVTY